MGRKERKSAVDAGRRADMPDGETVRKAMAHWEFRGSVRCGGMAASAGNQAPEVSCPPTHAIIHSLMKGFIKEFKAFAMRGNVMDLAVGVIIGGAFGKIVSSLVDNIFTPVIGALTSGKTFENSFQIPLGGAGDEGAAIKLGAFFQSTMDFLIIAFCVFLMVKMINKAQSTLEGEPEPEEGPPQVAEDIKLLREIRDALKQQDAP